MKRSVPVAILVLSLLLSGCNGSAGVTGKKEPASTASPVSGAADSTSPGSAGTPGTGSRPGSASPPGGSSTPGGSAPGKASPGEAPADDIDASLDRKCVRSGVPTDRQGLTVRTRPEAGVAYTSIYSDNSSRMTRSDYASGDGVGQAGADGTYRVTWVVPAGAPTGVARVSVVTTASGQSRKDLTFTIVAKTETCP